MSQAEELLATLSDTGMPAGVDTSIDHIIIDNDRNITVPNGLKRLGVQYDHDIETVTFDCPRYWDEHDMSQMKVCINYRRADGALGMYIAKGVTVDPVNSSIMHFTWTISRNVTEVKGNIAFLVCVKKTDDEGNEANHWNSELTKECYISEGLECEDPIIDMYPDFVTDMLLRMDYVESIATPSSMREYIDDYMNDNPEKMQECVDEYFSNDEATIEYINTFIEDNMASLIDNGLLEITRVASIEKSGTVTPTAPGKAILENILGDSYQTSYSGKNLLNISSYTSAGRGVTFTTMYDKNGRPYNIKVTGTVKDTHTEDICTIWSSESSFPSWAEKGVEYTAFVNEVGVAGLQIQVYEYLNSKWTNLASANSKMNFTISDEATGMMVRLRVGTGYTLNSYAYPMIVKATETDLSYAPYNGGAGSPSPDYPEVIDSASDSGWFDGEWLQGAYSSTDGSYTSNNAYCICSKNKIPCKSGDVIVIDFERESHIIPQVRYWNNGSYVSYDGNKDSYIVPDGVNEFAILIQDTKTPTMTPDKIRKISVTINGTYAAKLKFIGKNLIPSTDLTFAANVQDTKLIMDNLSLRAGTYTLSWTQSTTMESNTRNTPRCDLSDGTPTYMIIAANSNLTAGKKSWTFTLNKDEVVSIKYWVHTPSVEVTMSDFQLEAGSVATDYTPYKESYIALPINEPLRSMDDVKDEICMRDGKYGVLRKIGYNILNVEGTTWGNWFNTDGYFGCNKYPIIGIDASKTIAIRSDRYVGITRNVMRGLSVGYSAVSLMASELVFRDTRFTTVSEFIAYAKANKISLEYILAEPVFEPFEDQSVFYVLPSYDGATNVYIVEPNENVYPIVNNRLPKNEDGSLLTVDYTTSKRNEAVLADGRVKFRVTEDGELEASIFVEEEV